MIMIKTAKNATNKTIIPVMVPARTFLLVAVLGVGDGDDFDVTRSPWSLVVLLVGADEIGMVLNKLAELLSEDEAVASNGLRDR